MNHMITLRGVNNAVFYWPFNSILCFIPQPDTTVLIQGTSGYNIHVKDSIESLEKRFNQYQEECLQLAIKMRADLDNDNLQKQA